MPYVNVTRPGKCFGVLVIDDWDKTLHVINEVRAHDGAHAARLALARARRASESKRMTRLRVHSVYRGILSRVDIAA